MLVLLAVLCVVRVRGCVFARFVISCRSDRDAAGPEL